MEEQKKIMAERHLAKSAPEPHLPRMAAKAPKAKPASRYAGRSALTGMLVLKPVSKGGTVTLAQVRSAIRRIRKQH